jgi:hypothetical protein
VFANLRWLSIKIKSLEDFAFIRFLVLWPSRWPRAQFAEKTVPANADEREHLADFEKLWSGLEKQWLDNLSGAEREKFERLTTDSESAAFRIIRSYATKAQQDGAPDFPIFRDNLGKRLGITGRGAGLLRQKFVDLAIIERTAPYKPNVAPARYRWTARF